MGRSEEVRVGQKEGNRGVGGGQIGVKICQKVGINIAVETKGRR